MNWIQTLCNMPNLQDNDWKSRLKPCGARGCIGWGRKVITYLLLSTYNLIWHVERRRQGKSRETLNSLSLMWCLLMCWIRVVQFNGFDVFRKMPFDVPLCKNGRKRIWGAWTWHFETTAWYDSIASLFSQARISLLDSIAQDLEMTSDKWLELKSTILSGWCALLYIHCCQPRMMGFCVVLTSE